MEPMDNHEVTIRPHLTTMTYEQISGWPAPAGAKVVVKLNDEMYVLPILSWGLFIVTFKSNLNPTYSETMTLPLTYFPHAPGRTATSLDFVQPHQFVNYDFSNVK